MRAKERKNENKGNVGKNKGFSLVELIIVIAIMAVLTALLAPQFTKYIDRSRQSADASLVSGIVTAAQVGVADVTSYDIQPGIYTVTIGKNGTNVTSANLSGESGEAPDIAQFSKAIEDSCGPLEKLTVTAAAWDSVAVKITVTSTYAVTIEYEPETFRKYVTGE